MKKNRKLISVLLILIHLICLTATVSASDCPVFLSQSKENALNNAISNIEMQKEQLGLDEVDFDDISVGQPLQTYIYTNNTFQKSHLMYPVISHEKLIMWAIEINGDFQITSALVDELNKRIDINTPFTIVYDRNSVYLFYNNIFSKLKTSVMEDDSRAELDINLITDNIALQTTKLNENAIMKYSSPASSRAVIYKCDVDFVSQNPPSDICWAATIACIANYRNGTSLTAVYVAKNHFGDYYNQRIDSGLVPQIMSNYDLYYIYRYQVPSDNVISENIRDGFPVYSIWNGGGGRHAVCIYGINPISGYLYIMDPEYGFTSSVANKYVSGYSGITLTLEQAVCHSW